MPATAPGRRPHTVVARANSVRRHFVAGAFVLAAVVSLGCRDTTEPQDTCANIQDITISVPVEGTLGAGDCRLSQDNSYVDYWRFVLTETTTLQIDLASTEFNAYLFLTTTSGTNVEQTDEGGGGDNARLTVTRPPGTYHVLANSSDPGETGAYQLTVAVVPPG